MTIRRFPQKGEIKLACCDVFRGRALNHIGSNGGFPPNVDTGSIPAEQRIFGMRILVGRNTRCLINNNAVSISNKRDPRKITFAIIKMITLL